MLTLSEIRRGPIAAALSMLPAKMECLQAEVMLLAITQQEDLQQRRRQWPTGPARGLLQFELGGGVRGVLTHPASRDLAAGVCRTRGVPASASAVHSAIEHDDVLAMAFGRLLLWTDPGRLPALGQDGAAWDLYLRTWRPGKPRPEEWQANYDRALAAVQP